MLIFLNSDGIEVDRLLGFYSSEDYMKKITNIFSGVDTFLSLKNSYNSGEKDTLLLSILSDKCEISMDIELCKDVYSDVIKNKGLMSTQAVFKAELFFAKTELGKGLDLDMFKLLDRYSNPESLKSIYNSLIDFYQSTNQTDQESMIYKEFSDRFTSDPNILNGYAWRMSELKINLEDALEKSEKAIILAAENPQNQANIIDTKAEILWVLGHNTKAIETINLAIDINPKSDYFTKQKIKFQNSLKE